MLLTKIHIPASGNNLIHRKILFNKLDEGLQRKLILISAPPGFGKTTLLADWIDQNKISTAWFSIDTSDNDIVSFLGYVITSIQGINTELGQSALHLLKSPNPPSSESILNLLINDITGLKQDFLLVLDDFHLISNSLILNAFQYLVENSPENLHIVILSRSDPGLPIAKLRSQNQLVEIRSSDLSFSTDEIAVLFNKKLNKPLSNDDVNSLKKKTEGWIAGLQLAAISMQGYENTSKFIEAFAGNNRYIMDYLIEEVLKIQPEGIKDFLLKSSILKQFSAPLCNELFNRTDSQIILEKLETNNMFVFPLDSERYWYRYHHLFADLLKQRLTLSGKSIVDELHNKACNWFEQNNMYELALDHALEINNYEKALQLLSKIVEQMWETGQHDAILKYGEFLPDDLIKKNPEFSFYYAWILISAGKVEKAEPFLISAERLVREILNPKNTSENNSKYYSKLLGKIAVAFAYMNSHLDNTDKTFTYCEIAMTNLSEDDPLWYSWAWFSYGISYFAIGELNKSSEAFNTAFEFGKKSGNIYLITTIVIRMAENEQQLGHYTLAYQKCTELLTFINEKGYLQITKADWTYAALYLIIGTSHFMWADMDKAYENIKIAYDLSKEGKDIYLKIFILMVYTVALKERGENEYNNKINELETLIENNSISPFLNYMLIGWKIYLLIDKQQLEEANTIVLKNDLALDKEKTPINDSAYSAYARLLMAQGQFNEAEKLISELMILVTQSKRLERIIELKILQASLFKINGNKPKAIENIIEAMELAYDEKLLSFFVFNQNKVLDLYPEVFKMLSTRKTKIPEIFIKNLKIALDRKSTLQKPEIHVEISSRELDTLKQIAEGLSNQDIAEKLFISLNTVKTHLKNINLKLEVNSRAKAVEKAKELGLI